MSRYNAIEEKKKLKLIEKNRENFMIYNKNRMIYHKLLKNNRYNDKLTYDQINILRKKKEEMIIYKKKLL